MNGDLVVGIREALGAKTVFGDPVQQGDAVVIPAARVRGGGGGGGGEAAEQKGQGSGIGLSAAPVGAFIVRGGKVSWRPAINVNRIIAGGQMVVALGLILAARLVKQSRTRRRRALRWI